MRQVLEILPSDSNKLLIQYQSPYRIVKKMSKVDIRRSSEQSKDLPWK